MSRSLVPAVKLCAGCASGVVPEIQIRMDLHVYRNSQDRWHDLRSAARERGAVLAVNATTLHEVVERLTPDVKTATPGQRLAALETLLAVEVPRFPNLTRYVYDAVGELKSARVQPAELRASGEPVLADILENYNEKLRSAGLCDPQDRRAVAALRVKELSLPWLRRFGRVVFMLCMISARRTSF